MILPIRYLDKAGIRAWEKEMFSHR